MLRNYLKVALRSLTRNRFIASLNILGLAIGMSASVIIFLYIRFEFSFDRFHKDHEQVYRIIQNTEQSEGQHWTFPSTLGWIGPLINKKLYPKVVACRIYNTEMNSRYSFREINHVRFYYVDSTFFRLFSFQFIEGSPETAFIKPKSVVLTQHMAEAYFGSASALGQEFIIHGKYFTVSAVLKNIPLNSHLQFDLLLPFESFPRLALITELPMDFPTYFRIDKKFLNSGGLEKVMDIVSSSVNGHYKNSGIHVQTIFQQLKDIHLKSEGFDMVLHRTGDRKTLAILGFLAVFVLLITISNFVNLNTSKSENRLKETGLRLISGADKRDILKQFIAESLFLALMACFFALAFTELFSGPFSNIVDLKIRLSFIDMLMLTIVFLGIAVITSIITGSVYYVYLSRLSPIQVLSIIRIHYKTSWLKLGLVIIQFTMMIFLLALFSIIYSQVRFMQQSDPGFDRDKMVVFYEPFKRMNNDFEPIRKNLLENANIFNATASEGIPGMPGSVQNIWEDGDHIRNSRLINEHRVKDHFFETFGIEIIDGRNFTAGEDTTGFLLNETAVRELGLKSPVGKVLNVDVHRQPVLGVIRDFQFKSLHDPIEPLVISKYFSLYKNITLRVNTDSMNSVVTFADSILKIHLPDDNFSHFLLSARYRNMYDNEIQSAQLLSAGALLAIIISMMGLFGLSSQVVIRRTKEIGIRKANGGTSLDIMLMLIKDLLMWVVISLLIALPAAAWVMHIWMSKFAYRINNQWLLLVLTGVFCLVIGLLTISYHTYTLGRKNPVESLRYE